MEKMSISAWKPRVVEVCHYWLAQNPVRFHSFHKWELPYVVLIENGFLSMLFNAVRA